MVARAIEAEVGQEGFDRELAGRIYRTMRVLSQGPQDERYLISRLYGLGFPRKTAEELMAEMQLDPQEFEELRRRGVARLRRARG